MATKKPTMAKNVNLKNEPEDNYKSKTIAGKGPSKKEAIAKAKKNEGFAGKKKK